MKPPSRQATVIPFRFSRCVGRIRRTAISSLGMAPGAAQKHVAAQVQRLFDGLVAKGVAPDAAASEARAYEGALRAQIWRLTLLGEDVG